MDIKSLIIGATPSGTKVVSSYSGGLFVQHPKGVTKIRDGTGWDGMGQSRILNYGTELDTKT